MMWDHQRQGSQFQGAAALMLLAQILPQNRYENQRGSPEL